MAGVAKTGRALGCTELQQQHIAPGLRQPESAGRADHPAADHNDLCVVAVDQAGHESTQTVGKTGLLASAAVITASACANSSPASTKRGARTA